MRLRYSDGRCLARIVDVTWPLHSKPVSARFCGQSSAGELARAFASLEVSVPS